MSSNPEIENQRIKAYLQLREYDRADELASNPLLATNIETMNHRVRLAALRGLPVKEYLQRMDRMVDARAKMLYARIH